MRLFTAFLVVSAAHAGLLLTLQSCGKDAATPGGPTATLPATPAPTPAATPERTKKPKKLEHDE